MNLTDPIFTDENKAREHFEATRWPNGPYCPHCGETERVYRLHGKSHRPGVVFCNSCDKPFTVTVGTVIERSHVPLNKWALAFRLMCSSKKGVSAHQLHRTLAVTYKTAWFMAHRIREAMRPNSEGPLGGDNKVVEIDETYVGGKARNRKGHVPPKEAVVALVERDGRVRSRHVRACSPGSPATAPSTTASRNMYAASSGTPTRSRVIFRSSSAASSAPITTSRRNTLSGISASSISATTSGPRSASMTASAPPRRSEAQPENG